MKNSIVYLPSDKQADLEVLVKWVLKRLYQTVFIIQYGSYVQNPLKVVPLIHSNLTPVKFSHSPFCLFLFSSYSSCPLCRVLH